MAGSPLHSKQTVADGIHIPYAFTYNNASERQNDTSLTSDDVGKMARQLDDNTLYILTSATPTWVDVGNSAAAGTDNQVQMDALKNTAGTITTGDAVYITGYDDGYSAVTVELAKADSDTTMPCIGLATENITDVNVGKVRLLGELGGLDTSSFVEGKEVFVSASVAGGLTGTSPVGPNIIQRIGVVQKSNASTGTIAIAVTAVLPLSDTAPLALGSAAAGTANTAARDDHVHSHGSLGGGTQHAEVTQSTAGFMSAADKTKLDNKLVEDGYCTVPVGLRAGVTSVAGVVDPATNNNMAALAFRDQASDGESRWVIDVPSNYSSGGIGVRMYWSIAATGGGGSRDSRWELGYKFLTVGQSLGAYSTTEKIISMDAISIDDLNLTLLDTISHANVDTNADCLAFRIARTPGNAADNFNADIYVHRVELVYTGDRPGNIHGSV